MSAMHRLRVAGRVAVGVALPIAGALALSLSCGTDQALAARAFMPRQGFALGLEPAAGRQEIATATNRPVVYHGGDVMRDVTIHTVYWAPPGYRFDGSPGAGALSYQALISQFFSDGAHDSGSQSSVLSLLDQYGDRSGVGSYAIHFDPTVDSVIDSDPYPAMSSQCASPSGVGTCITDLQLQQELDRLIGPSAPGARGLSNLWFVLLPPDVDTCIAIGSCGTNAYAGYHSAFQLGHGETIYSAIPDPLIEYTPGPGSDPEGNPEAASTIDTMAHELVEAITDPLGTGWMDPNGFETADKCENGPQTGAPLGYAANGSPYNQVIDGHQYLIQDIWSNAVGGCVQRSTAVASIPPLHSVRLRQFSSAVGGATGAAGRVSVAVTLLRAGVQVASASGETRANGTWGPLVLRDRDGRRHAVGDDRDELTVVYGGGLAADSIDTGDGGNPFTASGWTGWFDLDSGYAVHSQHGHSEVLVGPCSQTGVLSLRIGKRSASPTDLCGTESDAATVTTPRRLGARTRLALSSDDNRGSYLIEPDGVLVDMSISLGEPDSIGALHNGQVLFAPTGFPTCTAFMRIGVMRCDGLVPKARYRLLRAGKTIGRGRAGAAGVVTIAGLDVAGGDVVTLVNAAGRRLTSLHVAHLRVGVIGSQTRIASGACQPGEYWGRPPSAPQPSVAVGIGIGGSGTICPLSGRAKGLSAADIAQTDEFSGGQTETQVPLIESTAPIQDETMYGRFIASAQSGLPGPHGS
ncbi:MAG: hypothetical protein ACRDMX_03930, partial [Solirubrobacteraceae bacterium]